MTVAQLIEDLKKCPQDADVYVEGDLADIMSLVNTVENAVKQLIGGMNNE